MTYAPSTAHNSLTVSYKRTPQAIAKDILNRFMPSFVKAFNAHEEVEKTRKKDAEYRRHIAQAIVKVNSGSRIIGDDTGVIRVRVAKAQGSIERFQIMGDKGTAHIRP
ncbi:MAG: hypothetical protein HRU28_01340 [Rhizobiales bacterium]|nr:hypothetical protein [Hyphomicrobiales bacterium]